jgi:hypothetical protein
MWWNVCILVTGEGAIRDPRVAASTLLMFSCALPEMCIGSST